MTSFEEFNRFNNSIEAKWRSLRYPAMMLILAFQCKYFCSKDFYLTDLRVLPPAVTSLNVTDLAPGTICEFTLKAIYNPASTDDGIKVTYMTL